MMVPFLAYLHELNFPSKIIDYLLISLPIPPFDCHIVLPTRRHNPKRGFLACYLMHLRVPNSFLLRQVNVSSEDSRFYVKVQLLIQKFDESVEAMVRCVVAAVDQWIRTVNSLCLRIIV